MPTKTKLKKLFVSPDFFLAVVVAILILIFAPNDIPLYLAREVFLMSVSVLAIVFSVFFAGVAVIMTAGDNSFISFLEEDGTYSRIVWSYKVTLVLLFIALVLSNFLFVYTLSLVDPTSSATSSANFSKALMVLFGFISSWALFAAINSASDAITYANLRARFIDATHKSKDESETG